MSELSSIKSQALTERIEERLFAYILDNHLKVGAKLPNEHELAAHFEVSRGTVREAAESDFHRQLQCRTAYSARLLRFEPSMQKALSPRGFAAIPAQIFLLFSVFLLQNVPFAAI